MGAVCGSSRLAVKLEMLEEVAKRLPEKGMESDSRADSSHQPDEHVIRRNFSGTDGLLERAASTSIEIIHTASFRRQTSGGLVVSKRKSRSYGLPSTKHKATLSPGPFLSETRLSEIPSSGSIPGDWQQNHDLVTEKAALYINSVWPLASEGIRRISSDTSLISVSDKTETGDKSVESNFSIKNVKVCAPTTISPDFEKGYLDDSNGQHMALGLESDKSEKLYLEREGCHKVVANWLRHFGSDVAWRNYAEVFERKKIDALSLYSLKFEDLRSLGVLELHAIAILTSLHLHTKSSCNGMCGTRHEPETVTKWYQANENNRSASNLKQTMWQLLEKENKELKSRAKELEMQLSKQQLENKSLVEQLNRQKLETEDLRSRVAELNLELQNQTAYIGTLRSDLNQCVQEVSGLETQLDKVSSEKRIMWEDLQVEKQTAFERRIENGKLRNLLSSANPLVPFLSRSYSTEGSQSIRSESSGDGFDMYNFLTNNGGSHDSPEESKVQITKGKTISSSAKMSKSEDISNHVQRDLTSTATNISELAPPHDYLLPAGGKVLSPRGNTLNLSDMNVADDLQSPRNNISFKVENIDTKNIDLIPKTEILPTQDVSAVLRSDIFPNIVNNLTASQPPMFAKEEILSGWESFGRPRSLSNESGNSSTGSFDVDMADNLATPLMLSAEILASLTERASQGYRESLNSLARQSAITRGLASLLREKSLESWDADIPVDRKSLNIIPVSDRVSLSAAGWSPRLKKDFFGERTSDLSSSIDPNIPQDPKLQNRYSPDVENTQNPSLGVRSTPNDCELCLPGYNTKSLDSAGGKDDPHRGAQTAGLVRECLKNVVVDEEGGITWSDFSSSLAQYFPHNENVLRSVFEYCSTNTVIVLEKFLEMVRSNQSECFVLFRLVFRNNEVEEHKNANSSQILKHCDPSYDKTTTYSFRHEPDRSSTSEKGSDEQSLSYQIDLKNLSSGSWEGREEMVDK